MGFATWTRNGLAETGGVQIDASIAEIKKPVIPAAAKRRAGTQGVQVVRLLLGPGSASRPSGKTEHFSILISQNYN